ncbi:MAG TPA: hypothetical protein VFG38_16875 [Pseudomonadales bacterium]|nr:hypothetical protein [Pseudomonadales bacterium]
MNDIHIDDFYRDAAIVLHRLYASFPRRVTVFVEDIAGPITTDEFGVPGERFLGCFGALLWLAEEGYLRYADTIRTEAIDQAVLTGRCFNILTARVAHDDAEEDQALPESVRAEHSMRIHRLREALSSGSSTRVRGEMLEIIGLMAR